MADIGERKLASIRRISSIDPIPGADRIVCLTIDGWKLVSQAGEFKEGDYCAFFEIDSFLPVRPEFEFLRSRCFKSTVNLGDGFRLRTIKLRGQISQGLAMPLSAIFNEENGKYYFGSLLGNKKLEFIPEEGINLTEFLGVKKWEVPESFGSSGSRFGPMHGLGWPSFLQKTDQERAQNCLGGVKRWVFGTPPREPTTDEKANLPEEYLEKIRLGSLIPQDEIGNRDMFEVTTKLDGSSMTIYHNRGEFGVCSRNLKIERNHDNVFWKTALNTLLLTHLIQTGDNIAFQGELMGAGVQGNREQLTDHHFFIFDIFDIDKHQYFTPAQRQDYIYNIQNIAYEYANEVPRPLECFKLTWNTKIEDLLEMADSVRSIKHDIAEGLVFKSCIEGGPSFKVISNKFLLSEKD